MWSMKLNGDTGTKFAEGRRRPIFQRERLASAFVCCRMPCRYGICCGIKNDLLVEPSYVQEGVDLLLRCLGWSFFELYRFQDLERLSLEKMCPEKEILSTSRIHLDLVRVRPFRRKSSNTWRIAWRWLCWASEGMLLHPQTTLQILWRSLRRVSRKSVDNGVAT